MHNHAYGFTSWLAQWNGFDINDLTIALEHRCSSLNGDTKPLWQVCDEWVASKAGVRWTGVRTNVLVAAMLQVCGGSVATLKMHRQLISWLSSECIRRAKSPVGFRCMSQFACLRVNARGKDPWWRCLLWCQPGSCFTCVTETGVFQGYMSLQSLGSLKLNILKTF